MFERLPVAPTSQELVDRAFRRAKKGGQGRRKEAIMITIAGSILADNLANLVRKYPSFDNLPPFYHDLADAVVSVDEIKIHLSRLGWASKKIRNISKEHLKSAKRGTSDNITVRKSAYGRMASVMKSIDPDLIFLNDARRKLRKIPSVDPSLPTIIVAGYPNVGKSSFMIAVTGARPEIAQYPFTTKGVGVGHFTRNYTKYQVVDTPGLLDRPLSQRNEIELQAIAALRHLRGVILYILDPSEHCGFSLKDQLNLLADIKSWLHLPVLVVANKNDLREYNDAELSMSTLTGEGKDDVLDRLVRTLDEFTET